MEQKKYILTDETIKVEGHTLHRIEYNHHPNLECADFTKGAKGGFIESEKNLSQEGTCWVGGNAMVFGNAVVSDGARVTGNAIVCAQARIREKTVVHGNVRICGSAEIYENANIGGVALIGAHARIHGRAQVWGDAIISDKVDVGEFAIVGGQVHLYDAVSIAGSVSLNGHICINGNATIETKRDYLIFKNHFSSGRFFVWTRSNNMWKVGCFHGTDEELIAKAMKGSPEKAAYYQVYVDTKNRLVALDEKFNKEKQQPE